MVVKWALRWVAVAAVSVTVLACTPLDDGETTQRALVEAGIDVDAPPSPPDVMGEPGGPDSGMTPGIDGGTGGDGGTQPGGDGGTAGDGGTGNDGGTGSQTPTGTPDNDPDLDSFYACSAGGATGGVPIVLAFAVGALRRRRRR